MQFAIPLVLAALAWRYMDLAVWLSVTPGVMLALSVIAAAVLFRLGRGLPEFSVQELEIEDIRKLTGAYTVIAKRLGAILALIGLSIGLLISAHFFKEAPACVNSAIASLGAFSFGLVLCRTVALVKGDLDLIGLQSKLLVKDVRLSRVREQSDTLEDAQKRSPFKNPTGYGGLASQ